MIISTATFTLDSGLSGGAKNMNMLIAGRLVQGIGAGGINVLIELIIFFRSENEEDTWVSRLVS